MNLIKNYIKKQTLYLEKIEDIPNFKPGDTVKVYNKIIDDNNEKIQIFEGVCIAKINNNLSSTFKIKKNSCGIYFEKTFPLYSPLVTNIILIRKGKVRQSKLYFMRKLFGKAAKIKKKTLLI